jgi:uncharacterized protein YlxW (UPF0749 family)
LTEKVRELKLTNAKQNNIIGNLKLKIRAEEYPYQQKAKELEERVSFYKSKVRQMEKFQEMENALKGCNMKLLQCLLVGLRMVIISLNRAMFVNIYARPMEIMLTFTLLH